MPTRKLAARDRPRHRRYSAAEAGCCADWAPGEAETEAPPPRLSLLNVSFGGLCFRTSRPLYEHDTCGLIVSFGGMLPAARVKCRVLWVRRMGSEYLIGARFTETNRAWFGADNDVAVSTGRRAPGRTA